MRTHIAILLRPYVRLVLEGHKTIESRFTRNRLAPWQMISRGDVIYFKATSGPFVCRAIAGRVQFFDQLTPEKMQAIRKQHNDRIAGQDAFWHAKRSSRYGTLIELRNVTPVSEGPAFPKSHGLAWFVLQGEASVSHDPDMKQDDSAHAACSTTMTPGSLRNRYLRVPRPIAPGPVVLTLPDAQVLSTDITPGRMIRHRAWGSWFDSLAPGDKVHFEPAGHRCFLLRIS